MSRACSLMERIVNQIHNLLLKRKKSIATAESCTAGLLSTLLTDISGSSKYFVLGVVAYSNKAKIGVLRIPRSLILKKGAVSKDVALRMAQQIRKIAKTDFGIAITGIAGPTGATPRKPLGTVFIAIDSADKKICKEFHFKGNRREVRKAAAINALKLLTSLIK
jgi:nicotinamide-nucleotide amidase